jgi:hypothetical protein
MMTASSVSRAQRLLHTLVAKADIFVHNVRAQTAVAMTIDYDFAG